MLETPVLRLLAVAVRSRSQPEQKRCHQELLGLLAGDRPDESVLHSPVLGRYPAHQDALIADAAMLFVARRFAAWHAGRMRVEAGFGSLGSCLRRCFAVDASRAAARNLAASLRSGRTIDTRRLVVPVLVLARSADTGPPAWDRLVLDLRSRDVASVLDRWRGDLSPRVPVVAPALATRVVSSQRR